MKRFITHVFNEGLPNKGLRKVSYLTMTDEYNNEFFLGTDNNPIYLDQVERMVESGKAFPICGDYPELKKGKSLYVDKDARLYFANRLDAEQDVELLKIVMKQMKESVIKQKLRKYLPNTLPTVNKYHEYT